MKTFNDEGTGAVPARQLDYLVRPRPKPELRKDSRRRAFELAEKSPSLAMKYPGLKNLTMDLLYFDREMVSRGQGLRYRANLETAKSILQFICPSSLCQGGGFDLSKELCSAVTGHRKTGNGDVHCLGFRDQEGGKTTACESILRFKMTLAFKTKSGARRASAVRA
jgi:hypothetical protein